MTAHCSLEMLSAYVDHELPFRKLELVEEHVAECPDCRNRVSALEGVVGNLRRLEQAAVPPTLVPELDRRLRVERARRPLSSRIEEEVRRATRQPIVAPLFALVLAFGVILYLFSLGVSMRARSGTQVVIGATAREPVAPSADVDASQDLLGEGTSGDQAVAQSTAVPTDAAAAAAPGTRRRFAGRTFVLREAVWIEEGVGERSPGARLDVGAEAILPRGLEPLLASPGVYRLLQDGVVLEVVVLQPEAD